MQSRQQRTLSRSCLVAFRAICDPSSKATFSHRISYSTHALLQGLLQHHTKYTKRALEKCQLSLGKADQPHGRHSSYGA